MSDAIFPAVCSRKPSRPFETKYGQRIKAEFTLDGGSTVAVFADASDVDFQSVREGQQVSLLHGTKGYRLGRVGESAPPSQPRPAASGGAALFSPVTAPPVGQRDHSKALPDALQVRDYVEHHAKVLAFCWRTISKQPEFSELSIEDKRALAASLYIQTTRAFY